MIRGNVAATDIDRLRELASDHLYVRTDAKSYIKDIPPELVEGSYRWRVYVYSNLYRPGADTICLQDKALFIRISKGFQIQHMNPWSRGKVYPINLNRYWECRRYVLDRVYTTVSFYELRACLYLLANFRRGECIYDDYIRGLCPGISKY